MEEGGRGGGGGRGAGKEETRGAVSSKRGPNIIGWLGIRTFKCKHCSGNMSKSLLQGPSWAVLGPLGTFCWGPLRALHAQGRLALEALLSTRRVLGAREALLEHCRALGESLTSRRNVSGSLEALGGPSSRSPAGPARLTRGRSRSSKSGPDPQERLMRLPGGARWGFRKRPNMTLGGLLKDGEACPSRKTLQ